MKYTFLIAAIFTALSLQASTVTFDVEAASSKGTKTLSQVRTELGETILIEKDNFEAQITATEYQKPSIATNGRTALKIESKILDKTTGTATVVESQKVITLSGQPVTITHRNAFGEQIQVTVNPVNVR